jgi:hypothetical protein
VDPKLLANECREKVNRVVAGLKQAFPDFESTGICLDQDQIQVKLKQLSDALDRGEKCSDDDF